MKKLLIVIVSVVSVSIANAQTQFGVKGGVNISTITGDNSSVFSSSIAAHAGGQVSFKLDKQFSLQPEFVFSFEGAKFNTNGVTGRASGNYINIPVLGQYHPGSGFILQSGPQMGLLLSASMKVTNQGSHNIKDQMKSTDFSWVFGTSFVPEKSKLGFSIRYNLGLSNINAGAGPSNHTSCWQLGTFILLNTK